jgi:hypothetical protein
MSPLRMRTASVVVLALTALAVAVPSGLVGAASVPATTHRAPAGPWRSDSALLAGPAAARAAAASHSVPLHVVPDGAVRIASAPAFQTSSNWSGYVAGGGPQFTSVSGQWTVPSVQPASPLESSASWLGIGGTDTSTLIQTGTTQETNEGATEYFAWYELLPSPAITIGDVSPGDTMSASISQTAPNQWSLTIEDLTSSQHFTGTGTYDTAVDSAEWIEEAPTLASSGQLISLADFGTVNFNHLAVQGSDLASEALTPFAIVDGANNVLAYPSTYQPSGAFSVTFGAPTSSPGTTTTTTTPVTPTTSPPPTTVPVVCPTAANPVAANQSAPGRPVSVAATRLANGCGAYWVVTAQGQVIGFGGAPSHGDLSGVAHPAVIAIAATPDGGGYWLVTVDGEVHPFGDAARLGDLTGTHLNATIVAMAVTPDGLGYWLVGSDGGIFAVGDAHFYGSTGALKLNKPVVGIAPASAGAGYWLVGSDGGIFAFGKAPYLGSMGATRLNRPVVGITAGPGGVGYRMVGSDGGIFSFGAPFSGSLGANPPAAPIVTMSPSVDGHGYYMLGADGSVYNFGDAPKLGNVTVTASAG